MLAAKVQCGRARREDFEYDTSPAEPVVMNQKEAFGIMKQVFVLNPTARKRRRVVSGQWPVASLNPITAH